jgi:hypothetical protein
MQNYIEFATSQNGISHLFQAENLASRQFHDTHLVAIFRWSLTLPNAFYEGATS